MVNVVMVMGRGLGSIATTLSVLIFIFLLIFPHPAVPLTEEEETNGMIVNWTTCKANELTNYLQQISTNFSHITRLVSIGKSNEGKDLWVLIISDKPNDRPLLRPQVKFVGNINGFSGPSCYILLRFINHLLLGYERENSLERNLISTNEIHILPNMNPDGFRKSAPGVCDRGQGRYNALGIDLNRNFPDLINPVDDHYQEPETKAVMSWIHENSFMFSMSYFTGALVVSYPFDTVPIGDTGYPTDPHPHFPADVDIFKHLATTYVQNVNAELNATTSDTWHWHCPSIQRTFNDGIVNGAEWMPVSGTMLDYNYYQGTFELLAGISCCRNENNTENLDRIWLNQKMAMLKVIQETDFGVRGQVVDSDTWAGLQGAQMRKLHQNFRLNEGDEPMIWQANSRGEFWRPLLPGKYIMEVNMPGYKIMAYPFDVSPTQYTRLFIELQKIEPTTTTTTPNPKPTETMSNDISLQMGITDEEKLELGDQWQGLHNQTHQSHSGWQVEEEVEQNVSSESKPKSNKSWLEKLFSSNIGVSVQSSAVHLKMLMLTKVIVSLGFP